MDSPKQLEITTFPFNGSSLYNDSSFFWFGSHKNSGAQSAWVFLSIVVLSLTSLTGNSLTLIAFLSWKKMKTGQNVLLCNVSISDILFTVCAFIPAIVTYVHAPSEDKEGITPVSVLTDNIKKNNVKSNVVSGNNNVNDFNSEIICRSVHYLLSVTLYVAIYSPVAACVFRFFAETLRDGTLCTRTNKRNNKARYSLAQRHSYHPRDVMYANNFTENYTDNILTVCNAVISCVVIWLAFFLSNINLLQNPSPSSSDNLMSSTSIIGLHQPFLCNDIYTSSLQQQQQQQQQKEKEITLPSMVYQQHLSQQQLLLQEQQHQHEMRLLPRRRQDLVMLNTAEKLRTLWLIFLICAFLIPLAIISIFSAVLLFRLQCQPSPARNPLADVIPRDTVTSYSTSGAMVLSEYAATVTSQRDSIILIMAISVARSLCWLPVQVCLLLDVFGPDTQNDRWSSFHMKVELFGTSFALLGCTLDPVIYYFTSADFRRSLVTIWRLLCRNDKRPKHLALERLSQARSQRNQIEPSSINHNNGVYERCGGVGSSKRPTVSSDENFDPKYNSLLKSSESDANETILSIISDSSNRINYT